MLLCLRHSPLLLTVTVLAFWNPGVNTSCTEFANLPEGLQLRIIHKAFGTENDRSNLRYYQRACTQAVSDSGAVGELKDDNG